MNLLLTFFFATFGTLAVVHFFAMKFFLYWKYDWFDIPMHAFGGLCVALGFSILPFLRISLPSRYGTLIVYLLAVVLVGILWEIFEVATGIATVDQYYWDDTSLDLVMDVVGGTIGYFFVQSIKRLEYT